MKKELENPQQFQPNEKFTKLSKYSLLITNKDYDKRYITLGNLPAVIDDLKNAKQTVKMMGIIPEHTYIIKDASRQILDEKIDWLSNRAVVQCKLLVDATGIKGVRNFIQGMSWKTLKPNAMKLKAPFDFIIIDLSTRDQKLLEDFMKLQNDAGGLDESIGSKNDSRKILGIHWK